MSDTNEIILDSNSIELDCGETLKSLFLGDSVILYPETPHPGLWVVTAFHGDYDDHTTLQRATYTDCVDQPDIKCKFAGTTLHAHPITEDGVALPRPA